MKNFNKFIFWGASLSLAACLSSCTNGAKIVGTLNGAADADVVVARLNVNRFTALDTVKTNAAGKYTYKMEDMKPPFLPEWKVKNGRVILKKEREIRKGARKLEADLKGRPAVHRGLSAVQGL